MRKHRKTRMALTLVLLLGVEGWFAFREGVTDFGSDRGKRSEALHRYGFRWPRGETYRYALQYETQHEAIPFVSKGAATGGSAEQVLTGRMRLRAELEIRSYGKGHGPGGQSYLLGAAIHNCKEADFKLFGQPIWSRPADCLPVFKGEELLFEADETGAIHRIYGRPETNPLFTHTLQTLLSELQVNLRAPKSEWRLTETTPHGKAMSEYALNEATGWSPTGESKLVRHRDHYASLHVGRMLDRALKQNVEGTHRIRLAPEGHVLDLRGTERLRADQGETRILNANTVLSMELVSRGHFAAVAPDLSTLDRRALADLGSTAVSERQLLEERTRGLKIEEALETLTEFGGGGQVPDHNRFLWRVTGLLQLHPEYCERLEPLFMDGRANVNRRALLLDILADVGNAEAQASLRHLLDADVARSDPNYAMLLQRFSFVDAPDAETVRWVETKYRAGVDNGDRNQRLSSAYTLGTLSHRLEQLGDETEAARINRLLQKELDHAIDPRETAHYLTALGAAQHAGNLPLLTRHATSESAKVRAAVVMAASHLESPNAKELIVDLAADPVVTVQGRAFRALHKQNLTAADLDRLARAVRSGVLAKSNVRALVTLGEKHLRHHPVEATDLLKAVLATDVTDAQARAAIRRLVG